MTRQRGSEGGRGISTDWRDAELLTGFQRAVVQCALVAKVEGELVRDEFDALFLEQLVRLAQLLPVHADDADADGDVAVVELLARSPRRFRSDLVHLVHVNEPNVEFLLRQRDRSVVLLGIESILDRVQGHLQAFTARARQKARAREQMVSSAHRPARGRTTPERLLTWPISASRRKSPRPSSSGSQSIGFLPSSGSRTF